MLLPTIPLLKFQELHDSKDTIDLAIQALPDILVNLVDGWDFQQIQKTLDKFHQPQQFSVIINADTSDSAVGLLDLGVERVILYCNKKGQIGDLARCVSSFPPERVGCLIEHVLLDEFRDHLPVLLPLFSRIGLSAENSSEITSTIQKIAQSQKSSYRGKWYISTTFSDCGNFKALAQSDIQILIPSSELTLNDDTTKINLAAAIVAPLKTDRDDGLFPTCVVNEIGVALGLVYSSESSIKEALKTRQGVYLSRKHGLWHKGKTSGATQDLLRILVDCDSDTLCFTVIQHGSGFCHLGSLTCFGTSNGIVELEKTIQSRKKKSPEGSYTHRLFNDPELLSSKIMEEAEELCQASAPEDVAWEAADLLYFMMVKCASVGVTLADVQANLDRKARKVTRRAGDAKPKWIPPKKTASQEAPEPSIPIPDVFKTKNPSSPAQFELQTQILSDISENERAGLLKRPILNYKEITGRVEPILKEVRQRGDAALVELAAKFDKVELSEVALVAPFPEELMKLSETTRNAIDQAYDNIYKFHTAQADAEKTLEVETFPGVTCTRFSRPIQRVGLYVPGGTAILPSTALMLGIPAKVAGCEKIVFATPPGPGGRIAPEVVYVAHRVGASHIIKAGGAQAVGALAYGTATIPKVDKICGPGNQYVTCAKMLVQNDTSAMVSIDMPAGPSEVLVIADKTSKPEFVASDLLSQAEHGPDSQAVLITVSLNETQIKNILDAVELQAKALPRKDIVAQSIAHSFHLQVDTMDQAIAFSNDYAPEHLILQLDDPHKLIPQIQNAGSVFLGHYSPESCGDYASGTNHTLPTYGYARMYAGVGWSTFRKSITSQYLTSDGLKGLGPTVETLARVEGLEAHARAVSIRLAHLSVNKS